MNADDFSPAGRKQIVTIFGAADIDLPYITLGEDFADFRTGECLAFTHDFDCLSTPFQKFGRISRIVALLPILRNLS